MFGRFINTFLSREKSFFQISVDAYFERNLEEDLAIFQRLHPKDNFGRSIAQHECQVYPFKKDLFLLNCIAFFLTPLILLVLLFKKRIALKDDRSALVCYNCYNLPSSLPEALSDKSICSLKSRECSYYLSRKDISFLFRFFIRSFWHPFLSLRVMLKVAKYRSIIDSFNNLEAIAITGEFMDTSSALTQYCHENGIKHYNFMQGDMLGSPRIAFFCFDKCFVWDSYYADLFRTYRACPEQFEVSMPQCLKRIDDGVTNKTIDFVYYVGGYPGEDLLTIRSAIDKLVAKGYICEVRPHPHWSDMDEIRRVFTGLTIQDTSSVTVDKSLLLAKNAIGLCSTVLLQAYYNDVHVVIDDLSCPTKYEMLKGYQYIMLNKPHDVLSEITKN